MNPNNSKKNLALPVTGIHERRSATTTVRLRQESSQIGEGLFAGHHLLYKKSCLQQVQSCLNIGLDHIA